MIGRFTGLFVIVGVALVTASGCGEAAPTRASGGRQPSASGAVRVQHRDRHGVAIDQAPSERASEARIVDDVARAVTDAFRLPEDVVMLVGGGIDGPAWRPGSREIVLPWTFLDQVRSTLEDAGYRGARLRRGVEHVLAFVVTHEVAHMLIDELELPVVGGEEDAADAFATVIMVSILDDGDLVQAAVDYFATADAGDRRAAREYFAAHSLDVQRRHALSCLVYGSDPERYGSFAQRSGFDQARRTECPEQWERTSSNWYRLIEPHVRDAPSR